MEPHDEYFSRENLYSLGIDRDSGAHYLSIPVSAGPFDYEEYYRLDDDKYARFLEDPAAAIAFAWECRRQEHDDLLLEKARENRGTAI